MSPLLWLAMLLLAALVASVGYGAPSWIQILLAVFTGLVVALTLFMYVWFAVKAPHQLRSEGYSLQHMAIDRGLLGDNDRGVIDVSTDPDVEVMEPARRATAALPEGKR